MSFADLPHTPQPSTDHNPELLYPSPSSSASLSGSGSSTDPDADSPPDWSQFSSLWDAPDLLPTPTSDINAALNAKFTESVLHGAAMDFVGAQMDLDLPLDLSLDFAPEMSTMAIDPSALHFDAEKFFIAQHSLFPHMHTHPQAPGDLLAAAYLSPGAPSPASSSSASGASFSPVPSHASVDGSFALSDAGTSADGPSISSSSSSVNGSSNADSIDPAYAIAEHARLAAGVTLAVPVPAPGQQAQHPQGQTQFSTLAPAAKLPIPRLPLTRPPSPKRKPTPPAGVPGVPRPKTSHTTIERRYRTNLNARIQALKDAVPALRVLDKRGKKGKGGDEGGKEKDGMSMEDGEKENEGPVEDVVDERGCVDGVKVPRKVSKANVLGKAAEYIQCVSFISMISRARADHCRL